MVMKSSIPIIIVIVVMVYDSKNNWSLGKGEGNKFRFHEKRPT